MQAATDRRSNDDDRVPLDALIELTHADGGEVLEADAVDVSSGGLSLRASFMPPLGARMQCSFGCPPHGDRVTADCEVVWSALEGPQAGVFGVRFLALDTRSATLIRRLLEPDNPHVREVLAEEEAVEPKSAPRRVLASLHIDGLGAPIEADVQVDEEDHVLLTQELDFLRLGRGVRVEIDGVVARRGRIASVKLEQTRGDTPALALGVLIDQPGLATVTPMRRAPAAPLEAPEAQVDDASLVNPEAKAATDTWPESPAFAASGLEEHAEEAPSAPAQAQAEMPPAAPMPQQPSVPPVATRGLSVASPARVEPFEQNDEATSEVEEAPRAALAHVAPAVGAAPEPSTRAPSAHEEEESDGSMPSSLAPRDLLGQLRTRAAALRAHVAGDLAERLPSWRTFWVELWAKLQLWFGSQLKRLDHFKRAHKKRRTTAPPPRKRTTAGRRGAARASAEPAARTGRGRLVVVGLLAFAGVSAAVYALAPRRGDDDLVLHRAVGPVESPQLAAPLQAQTGAAAESPREAPAPAPAAAPVVTSLAQGTSAAEAEEPAAPEGDALSFGAANVPNGRTYELRMSRPIERIEGEKLRGGFMVRIPGGLSLDRAGPIATSHPSLSRSLILNRGEQAELTIEFAPGKQPAYRVEAKGSTLYITVERQ